MKFFIDTADVSEIKELSSSGLLDGVTTNPSLIKKSGRNINEVIAEICDIVPGPVSAEVAATNYEEMLKEAEVLKAIAKNVTIKVPLTWDGLKACRTLRNDDVLVNVTLCFSASQALLAAKAGATFISPFVGRLDDIGLNGMDLISDICEIYTNYPNLNTEILVASIRNTNHVIDAAKIGADVVTLPPNVLKQLISHPLTDNGLKAFLDDWKLTGQSIT
ncbi:MAG: fructose-6-phosphate aldolase [Alphaproteobacteria bacterium]|nr:fructose-6-phosphate aldolase [Alphaproteobacteria bacterium]